MQFRKPRTIFDIAILIMICKVTFSLSAIVPYSEFADVILSFLSAGLFACCILLDKYNIKILFVYAIIGILVMISAIKTGNYGFMITVVACFAARKQNFSRMIEIIYQYELAFLIIHTIISLIMVVCGGVELYIFEREMYRATFGFGNPNTFSVYVFNLLLLWLWINYKKMNILRLSIIFCISLIVVSFTKTRTMMIDVVILIALCLLSKYKWFGRCSSNLTKFCIPFLSVIIWVLIFLYRKGFLIAYVIDYALNARIKLGAFAYEHFGLSLLGQYMLDFQVNWDEVWKLNNFTFDCIYTYLVVNQGIVWLLLLAIIFYKLSKLQNKKINIFLIVWALYGVTEVHGLNGFLCMPIMLSVFVFSSKYIELES